MNSVVLSKSENVTYFINRGAKEIVATIKCDENDPQWVFNSQLFKHIGGIDIGPIQETDTLVRKYKINSSYSGRAKCHPDDEFNEEFGKRLALLRAKAKYLRAMEDKIYLMSNWVYGLKERIDKLYLRQCRQLIDNSADLYKLEVHD